MYKKWTTQAEPQGHQDNAEREPPASYGALIRDSDIFKWSVDNYETHAGPLMGDVI